MVRYLLVLVLLFLAPALAVAPSASVVKVKVTGKRGAYAFAVTVKSPDTGCRQYADWWEVVTPDGGKLLYRRILLHSHVSEQPFTRSGGPVPVGPNDVVVVRVHVKPAGYSPLALKGSTAAGFEAVRLPDGFGDELVKEPPQPVDCWF